ncbi:MAG: alpha/beta hydrolase, partial [Bacteroidia bacterium]|nr:alpha/beta hydrolase [Bacteroidia bacterium]
TTLLCIHGLANYSPVFKYNISELSKHYRCVAVDLPGNGLSSRGDYPFTLVFYAESVSRFIQEMKLTNVVLVGHSMGGHVSILTALRYPNLVHKLVLLGTSGLEYFNDFEKTLMKGLLNMGSLLYGDAASLESAIQNSYYHEQKKDAKHIVSDLLALMQGEQGKYWRKMVKKNIEAMLDEQVYTYLNKISMETLLIFGKNDNLIPNRVMHVTETTEKLVDRAATTIPHCESKIIPRCGHFVQIEAADEVNTLILNFVSKK